MSRRLSLLVSQAENEIGMKQNMLWTALLVLTVLMTSLPVSDAEFTLTILHTNDFRARYEELDVDGKVCSAEEAMEGQCFGGIARLATVVKEVRQQSPNTLLLDAGDQFQGSLYFTLNGGTVTSYFMNLLGYDVMALGNHEFDRGMAGLAPFLENATFDVVSANIDSSNEPLIDGLFAKSVVRTVDGRRVGIIGYTTLETQIISSPGPNLRFDDIVSSVQAEVSRLQVEGVDMIIALGHAGFDVDKQVADIPGMDVVIGGQGDTFLYNGDPPSSEVPEGPYPFVVTQTVGGRTAVAAQCSDLGKYVCRLDVTFNDQGDVMSTAGNPVLLDTSVTPDPDTQLELSVPWMEGVAVLDSIVLGRTLVTLEGEEEQCRVRECNLGNILADGYVERNLDNPGEFSWNDVSIALLNGGAIGASVERGDIRASNLLQVLQFGDKLVGIYIEGRYLRGALEHSVSQLDPCKTDDLFGGFLQVSGLRVKYDLRKPVGRRVVSVVALCTQCLVSAFEPLEDDTVYKVILSEFIANGGDGYSVIADNIIMTGRSDVIDSEVFDDIQGGRPVFTTLEGRIQFVDCSDECPSDPSTKYTYRRYGPIPSQRQMSTARPTCQRSKARRTYH